MTYRVMLIAVLALTAVLAAGCKQGESSERGGEVAIAEAPAMQFRPEVIQLKSTSNSSLMELSDTLIFVDAAGTEWVAPSGTLTDGASVPRLALSITDGRFDPRFLKAAIVHDAYCQVENEDRTPDQFKKRPWQDVHKMFYEASLAGGTPQTRALLMYAAVRLGGPRWDDLTLDHVSDQKLQEAFEACANWIEGKDSLDITFEDLERWMEEQIEPDLLSPGQ